MDQNTLLNWIAFIIVGGALIVGLLSMLFGKIIELFDALSAWWKRGIVNAIHYRLPQKSRYNMSSRPLKRYRTSSEPPKTKPVRSDTDADRTSTDTQSEPVHEPPNEPDIIATNLRIMTDNELLVWLSVLRKPDGGYRFTANGVYDIVGGTRKDVLAIIAELREFKKPEPKPFNNQSLSRPIKGWR